MWFLWATWWPLHENKQTNKQKTANSHFCPLVDGCRVGQPLFLLHAESCRLNFAPVASAVTWAASHWIQRRQIAPVLSKFQWDSSEELIWDTFTCFDRGLTPASILLWIPLRTTHQALLGRLPHTKCSWVSERQRDQGRPLESVPHKLSFAPSSRGWLSTPHGRCRLAESQPWIFPFAAHCVSLLDASVRHQGHTFRPITMQFECVGLLLRSIHPSVSWLADPAMVVVFFIFFYCTTSCRYLRHSPC